MTPWSRLSEEIRALGEQHEHSAPEVHRQRTEHCPSLPRLVETDWESLTPQEQEHVRDCRYCRRMRGSRTRGLELFKALAFLRSRPALVATFVVASFVLSLGAFFQFTVMYEPKDLPTKTLVVARAELPLGSVLTTDDVTVIEVPEQDDTQGSFRNIEDVIDRSVTQAVMPNEPITSGRVTEKGAGFGLEAVIPEGYRAVAVAINQVSGVSGFILPGSHIDILLSATPMGATDLLTTTVLENVTVLSTGHKQQPSATGQPQNVPVVNMLLTPEDAELLTLAAQEGRIQLVLRNPKDEEITAEARGAKSSRDLFRKFMPEEAPASRRAAAPRPEPVVVMETPPPAIFQVEMIRGNKRTLDGIEAAEADSAKTDESVVIEPTEPATAHLLLRVVLIGFAACVVLAWLLRRRPAG